MSPISSSDENATVSLKIVVCYSRYPFPRPISPHNFSKDSTLSPNERFSSFSHATQPNRLAQQNQFLKELTFNQSHLMRSNLANIMGILKVMQPKKSPAELPELLALLKEEAFKLDKALQDSIHSSSSLNQKNFENND